MTVDLDALKKKYTVAPNSIVLVEPDVLALIADVEQLQEVAEAAHDMLRDHRFIGEQTQGYRTIEVFGRSLAKLQVALEAWKQGRTP